MMGCARPPSIPAPRRLRSSRRSTSRQRGSFRRPSTLSSSAGRPRCGSRCLEGSRCGSGSAAQPEPDHSRPSQPELAPEPLAAREPPCATRSLRRLAGVPRTRALQSAAAYQTASAARARAHAPRLLRLLAAAALPADRPRPPLHVPFRALDAPVRLRHAAARRWRPHHQLWRAGVRCATRKRLARCRPRAAARAVGRLPARLARERLRQRSELVSEYLVPYSCALGFSMVYLGLRRSYFIHGRESFFQLCHMLVPRLVE